MKQKIGMLHTCNDNYNRAGNVGLSQFSKKISSFFQSHICM
jgi:hypothetical protein